MGLCEELTYPKVRARLGKGGKGSGRRPVVLKAG